MYFFVQSSTEVATVLEAAVPVSFPPGQEEGLVSLLGL